jgi:hypothetical protein
MKDFTSYINHNGISPSNGLDITFVLNKPGNSKLNLVRAIKHATGLGLKDSKDIVDESSNNPVMFRKKMTFEDLKEFRELLANTNADFTLDDLSQLRRKKLVDLGICDKSDLIEEIISQNIYSIFVEGFSIDKISQLLTNIYSNITEDKLKEIYESNRKKEHNEVS